MTIPLIGLVSALKPAFALPHFCNHLHDFILHADHCILNLRTFVRCVLCAVKFLLGKHEHFFRLFQQHIVLDDFPIDVAPLCLYTWIVNTFLDNFFKVVFPVLHWGLIPQRGVDSVMVIPVYIIP